MPPDLPRAVGYPLEGHLVTEEGGHSGECSTRAELAGTGENEQRLEIRSQIMHKMMLACEEGPEIIGDKEIDEIIDKAIEEQGLVIEEK